MLGQCASAIMLLEYNAHYKARLVPRADAAAATKEAAAAGAEHHHGQGLHNDDIKALIPQAHCGKHPPEVWKDIIMKQWNDGYYCDQLNRCLRVDIVGHAHISECSAGSRAGGEGVPPSKFAPAAELVLRRCMREGCVFAWQRLMRVAFLLMVWCTRCHYTLP